MWPNSAYYCHQEATLLSKVALWNPLPALLQGNDALAEERAWHQPMPAPRCHGDADAIDAMPQDRIYLDENYSERATSATVVTKWMLDRTSKRD